MDEDIFVIDESGNLASEGYIDVSRVYIRDLLDVSNNTRLGLAGGATNIYGSLGVSGSVDLDNTLDVSGAVNFESVLNVGGVSTFLNNVEISGNLDVSAVEIVGNVLPQLLIKPARTNNTDAQLIIRGARSSTISYYFNDTVISPFSINGVKNQLTAWGFTHSFYYWQRNDWGAFVPNNSEGFNYLNVSASTGFIQLTLPNYDGIVEIKYGTAGKPSTTPFDNTLIKINDVVVDQAEFLVNEKIFTTNFNANDVLKIQEDSGTACLYHIIINDGNNARLRFENHDKNNDTNHLLGGINGGVTNSDNTGELRFNTSADGTTETLCVTMDSTNKTTIHGNLQVDGDVGVGTSNPNAKFEVIGDISCSGVYATGNIYATGDVTAFYSNTSDKRLKTNIETIENPLNIIANIRGVRFNWNDEAKVINEFVDLDKREIGVLAQEVEKELPEVIKEGFSGYKAVRYEKIIAVLIEGMKEQQSKINTLERLVQNLIERD